MDMKKYQPDAKQLEIGKRYEFSNSGNRWSSWTLRSTSTLPKVWYRTSSGVVYNYIREDRSEAGVIKAPLDSSCE